MQVIFDLGRVLLEWQPDEILARHTSDMDKRDALRRAIYAHADWLALDKGTMTEAEAVPLFARRADCSEAEVKALLNLTKAMLTIKSDTLEILEALASNSIPVYCLSNMAVETWDFISRRYEFFELFQHIAISGQLKMMKPEPEIFEHLLEKAEFPAEQTIFIDDHRPNVEAAETLGIQGHVFENAEDCRHALRVYFDFL
ncbi:MAG: HAD family phosphatase [Pseudomonadota bacterium]